VLKGVIFDMDGVLIDSHPAHLCAWRMFLCELGLNVSDRDLEIVLDGRKRQEILKHFLGELTEEQIVHHSRRKEEHFNGCADQVRPFPEVVPFLEILSASGILMAVATSASRPRAQATLERFNLKRYFTALATGNDVVHGKPHPAIFQLAASHLKLSPENVIAIDDAFSGVRAARAAGMRCIGMGSGDHAETLRAAGAHVVRENFAGLRIPELLGLFSDRAISAGASAYT